MVAAGGRAVPKLPQHHLDSVQQGNVVVISSPKGKINQKEKRKKKRRKEKRRKEKKKRNKIIKEKKKKLQY